MNLNQTIEAARNVLRFKHMAIKTEKSYVHWIRRFALWCKDHPAGSHEDKVRGFLTHLARERDVSASTQRQRSIPDLTAAPPLLHAGRPSRATPDRRHASTS